ncbi:MAG: hypothetical protein CVU57_03485 [Deltaproteobacteria bacterium HGW-Deltaproteobacteria-15]|jgi:hypothetical protein|nr:MAG: hypothetical protein CVU57_03485 [Deltaproteobacteria bacterium HGW-Deltaproteobacteria-15]
MNGLRTLFAACGLFLFLRGEGDCATTHYTNSLDRDVIQEYIDNIADDGDTIILPSGVSTWDSGVVVPGLKGLIISGAGIDETVITAPQAFLINGQEGRFFRLSGLTFRGEGEPKIKVAGTAKAWRIDNIKFEMGNNSAITVDGYTYGVIDNCRFVGTRPDACISVFENSGETGGADSWNRPLTLGTGDAVYVEECEFRFDTFSGGVGSIDSRSGGRYVFRYNHVKNQIIGHHDACATSQRGTFSWEVYGNTFEYTEPLAAAIMMRGGTGVIYNNRFSGQFSTGGGSGTPLAMTSYRSWSVECQTPWSPPCDFVREHMCDNGENNCVSDEDCRPGVFCVQIDGHLDESGYPCRDQLGRTFDADGDGIQDPAPAYEWNNTKVAGDLEYDWFIYGEGLVGMHIQEGRDYYTDERMHDYTPYPFPHPLRITDSLAPPSNLRIRRLR